MCLTIKKRHNIKRRRADKDYYVFKILKPYFTPDRAISPYLSFRYTLNKTYSCSLDKIEYERPGAFIADQDERAKINKGFHYCLTYKDALRYRRDNFDDRPSIYKCIIPKNTIYIDDPSQGLGASNRIIIIGKAKPSKKK